LWAVVSAQARTTSGVAAQQATITTTVIDATSRQPLAGARVTVGRAGPAVTTGPDGRIHLTNWRPGDTLRVTRIGYRHTQVPLPADGHLAPIALVAAPVTLAEIVTVAGRRPQSTVDLITPVLTIDRAELNQSGALSLAEALDDIPGVQASADPPARSTIQIRGIGGSRVLVLRDGEPVPGGLLEDRDLSRLSTSTTEQIEVVKGPLSVLYGSEAIGGVVNMVSRVPRGPLHFEAAASGGSSGRRTASVTAAQGGSVAWQLSGSYRSQDRIAAQVERPNALDRVWDLHGSAHHTLASAVVLRADATLLRERQRWPLDGQFNAFNDNRAIAAWLEASGTAAATRWRLRLAGQDFAHRYREAAGLIPFGGTGAPTQREQSARLLLTAEHPLGRGHTLDLGSEIATRRIEAADRLQGGTVSDESVDVWAQDGWQSGPWLATASGRASWSSRWGQAVTPAVAVAWEPGHALRLRATAARGFRAPSFKETGWNFLNVTAGYAVEGNPDLRPEQSWQYAVGTALRVGQGVSVDVELYRNDLVDLIDLEPTGSSSGGLLRYTAVNVNRARTQGLDLSVQRRGGESGVALAWSWLATEDRTTGQPLARRVPHSVRLTVDRTVAGRLDLSGTARWSARTPATADTPGQQSFTAVDLAATWRMAGRTDIAVGVDNLFNALPTGWQAPLGRAVRVGVRTAWQP
jgi:outer membrane receptor for ferrienterochelin and colicins